jgi:ABC-2 type transport system ATP-binding protein
VRTYSKGMKQRLGLATALVHDPEIYVLDEPMSGLDPLGRRMITDVILDLRTQGKTVFFSSHILSDAERLCDRIGILHKGKLLFTGTVQEVAQDGASLEETFVHVIEEHERPESV